MPIPIVLQRGCPLVGLAAALLLPSHLLAAAPAAAPTTMSAAISAAMSAEKPTESTAEPTPEVLPETLTLRAAVDAAWQRSPQARALQAQRNEVQAGDQAAQGWIAGSPVVGLSHRSDRWNENLGRRESELSLAAPIWLPGQQTARRQLAEANRTDLAAQLAHARLMLAGEVRERMWAVVAARETLAAAQNQVAYLEALRDDVMRRVKAGDLARTDGLLVQQELLAAQAAVTLARAGLNEPLTCYRTLTGQSHLPRAEPEPEAKANNPDNLNNPNNPNNPTTTLEEHPRMLSAHSALQQARATLGLASATRSEPPTVGVIIRREHDHAGAPAAHSLALSLQIALGSDVRNRVHTSAAQTRIETASAALDQTRATLAADIELARLQAVAVREALASLSARTSIAREHVRLIDTAFRLGERALADLLRAQSLAQDAHLLEMQQRVALGLAHARLNQALGILP